MNSLYSAKERRGWYLYDWAATAFSSTVVALFFGPYITGLAKAGADARGMIHPLGITVDARSYWSYLVSLSVLLQVLFLPMAGAIADYGRRKKQCLAATAYLGAAAAAAMFVLKGSDFKLGGALFLIANVSFGASIVIYNSFLPEIAPPEDRDAVSSRGWAAAYLGAGLLLILNLILYTRASSFGLTEGFAVRVSLCSAGVWWAIFTVPALLALRNRGRARALPPGQSMIGAAVRQLAHTVRGIRRYRQTMIFLAAYLLYKDAIETVVAVSTQFANDELKMPVSQLTQVILMVHFVGIAGALGFNVLARIITAKRAVAASLVIWTALLVYIYALLRTPAQFFAVAAVVALVLGGSQALSRSLYAQLIPSGKEAEYFSVYEISDKGTSWLCPVLFGLALQFTGSYRLAILSLVVFFAAGLLVLLKVDVEQGEREVLAAQAA
ncbi:MAG TPA: MFS transporter [Bryobacteraceae bacterium]|nr:MFS transporter [Bryobacteraceae bacterium]